MSDQLLCDPMLAKCSSDSLNVSGLAYTVLDPIHHHRRHHHHHPQG